MGRERIGSEPSVSFDLSSQLSVLAHSMRLITLGSLLAWRLSLSQRPKSLFLSSSLAPAFSAQPS